MPRTSRPAPRDGGTVTIAVCTRNRPELLRSALAAIREHSGSVELLVVDSASTTDETRAVAREADARYVRAERPGLSIARNIALREASGGLIVFTDDDCRTEPGYLAPLVAAFDDDTVHAATGRLHDTHDPLPAPAPPILLTDVLDGLDAGHGALMAFRTDAFASLGGFDPVLGAGRRFGGAEDLDALCRVLASGGLVAKVGASIVTHVYTRDDADYVVLNENYGRGIGAMIAKWLRENPAAGRALRRRVVRRALRRLARRVTDARYRRGQAAYLRGILTGYREARGLPLDGPVFRDEHPPDPVPTPIAIDGTETG
ncbi:glycosyltransferase family 2 protein [Agromyces protaetiae]|uniref:Glycosyltransferase family 2 protein n=1 Tax=Agromyces protaetiae TaxID=2509455 RepID=A0A4P6FKZ2_9MICO|nr:glycosyltransferase family A protein [Agromyces protaetiae]QAY74687.1 glycosyltransferase family 2 protein [Agromyces protaetiae]